MQCPVVRPPKGMNWLLGFARREKARWCKGQDGCSGCGRLTEALNQVRRWWGYSGNIPTNSRGSLFPEMPLFSWLSQTLGNTTGSSQGTIRRSNNISSDQPPLLTSAWLTTGVMYLPEPWVTEPLRKASTSSTEHEALSQSKMKMTCSKRMWMEEITKYFTVSAYEAYVENT